MLVCFLVCILINYEFDYWGCDECGDDGVMRCGVFVVWCVVVVECDGGDCGLSFGYGVLYFLGVNGVGLDCG